MALAHAGELHQTARECDAGRMRQLLAKSPAVNATDDHGMTPLHIAIDARQVECVALLLAAGADRTARDVRGRTAFRAADEISDREDQIAIRMHLAGKFGQNIGEDPAGPPPWSLEYSVMRGQTGVTKMLLAMGVDPNVRGSRGTTSLADAALAGNVEGVRLLLEAGARVDALSPVGAQPIHEAALGDSAEVIRALVAHGADVNALTRDEARTPLHFAAAMGKIKALEALVALGANLTAQDSQGRTPFDAAKRAGLADVAAFLERAASGE
jgi:ankyrin repeat protein